MSAEWRAAWTISDEIINGICIIWPIREAMVLSPEFMLRCNDDRKLEWRVMPAFTRNSKLTLPPAVTSPGPKLGA